MNVVVLVGTDDDAAALGETARTLESGATRAARVDAEVSSQTISSRSLGWPR